MTAQAIRPAAGQLRVVTDSDLAQVQALLATDPIETVFVAARIDTYGLDPFRLGCPVWGWFGEYGLEAICHAGSNLIPFRASPEALSAFADLAGQRRRCSSIGGPSRLVMPLWRTLCQRGPDWTNTRDVRSRQPLLCLAGDPLVPADSRVEVIERRDTDSYFDASVQMYSEEVGVPPFPGGSSRHYRSYVRQLIRRGHSFGIVHNKTVVFKADIGSLANDVAQIQGVWVHPQFRGRGLAAPAMAAVVEYARAHARTVSLYVNDFNAAAVATYRRVGFQKSGEFATILY